MFGFVFFIAAYLLGEWLSQSLRLPIPGAVVGLFLVLGLLIARGQVDTPLKEAADSFLKYLALMLVPIGVGVVKLLNPAPAGVWKLEVVLVLALIVGVTITGKTMQVLVALSETRRRRADADQRGPADARIGGLAPADPHRSAE